MVFRIALVACAGALLSFSLGGVNGSAGSAGAFFVARQKQQQQQQQQQQHSRSRKHVVVAQVQQPRSEEFVSRLTLEKERRDGRLNGLDRIASTAAAALGGRKMQPRGGAVEPAAAAAATTTTTRDSSSSNYNSKINAVVASAAVQQQSQNEAATTTTTTATYTGFGRQWRRISSSPLEALSSTGRQVGVRASASAAAWTSWQGKSTILRTRGGGSVAANPQRAQQQSPSASSSPTTTPQQQGADRWKYAVEGVKNGLASGLAAACVKTVLQPFDTMKTVQQFSTTRMTLLQAGRDLLARGGVPELYQGLGVTLVGSMPSVGIYFGLYQYVKKRMDARENMSPYISITVSAGVGNFIASFFRVPYEVVKQRLQVGQYPSTMIALQSIYRDGGIFGFFGKGGLQTQWARDIPYAMVTLLVYETLQKMAARRKGTAAGGSQNEAAKANPFENMIIGAIAGGMGSLVTNPMDMVKTRMMTSPELYAGPMDAAWQALSKEGPQAFLKGATPRLLHKIPANAFFFVTYEFFRTVLGVTR